MNNHYEVSKFLVEGVAVVAAVLYVLSGKLVAHVVAFSHFVGW